MINLEQYQKDLSVDSDGVGSMSRRALAKMSGVDPRAIRRLLNKIASGDTNLPKSLEPLAGSSFEGGDYLPDILCTAILEYYAFDAGRNCKKEAQQWFRAILQ